MLMNVENGFDYRDGVLAVMRDFNREELEDRFTVRHYYDYCCDLYEALGLPAMMPLIQGHTAPYLGELNNEASPETIRSRIFTLLDFLAHEDGRPLDYWLFHAEIEGCQKSVAEMLEHAEGQIELLLALEQAATEYNLSEKAVVKKIVEPTCNESQDSEEFSHWSLLHVCAYPLPSYYCIYAITGERRWRLIICQGSPADLSDEEEHWIWPQQAGKNIRLLKTGAMQAASVHQRIISHVISSMEEGDVEVTQINPSLPIMIFEDLSAIEWFRFSEICLLAKKVLPSTESAAAWFYRPLKVRPGIVQIPLDFCADAAKQERLQSLLERALAEKIRKCSEAFCSLTQPEGVLSEIGLLLGATFNSPVAAREWLESGNELLEGLCPADAIRAQPQAVQAILKRMMAGN
ncbi:hypothetical protein IC617_05365 [Neiella sp. HB171785]|uniref:Uncharacterized protein n=1 Tax=Neiella litorisoli TaxID=2771431 RepID=A0A8J6QGD3_9GAMM|nr:hypothetical protein [Neiella litorisoli]MBD1388850.1 hypothetical protein [Neiella litorisoli]